MNADIKKKWVEALRSGEYKQGRKALRNNGCFCCLGVLCDLLQGVKGGHWNGDAFSIGPDQSEAYLPTTAWKLAGLESYNPYVEINGCRLNLAVHNDNGRTFAEIADAIEAQL